jgi:tyrosyl-tRNA synthetase
VQRLGRQQGAALNEAKEVLATEVTAIVHGRDAADKARRAARSAFGGAGDGAADIPTTRLPAERLRAGMLAIDLFAEVGLVKSKSEARRLIKQGGARVGGQRVVDFEHRIGLDDLDGGAVLLRAGKKRVHRVVADE